MLPTNGTEPPYEPDVWNNDAARKTHNCYAYFLQDLEKDRKLFPQPGSAAALRYLYANRGRFAQEKQFVEEADRLSLREPYTCEKLIRAIYDDNERITPIGRFQRCPDGYYKGFLAVDNEGKDQDYHFWIQHRDGRWSHKPGKQAASNLASFSARMGSCLSKIGSRLIQFAIPPNMMCATVL